MNKTMKAAGSKPGLFSRLIRRIFVFAYKRYGWVAKGEIPSPRKFIILAAPHTSNWDFLYFLGLTDAMGIRPHFMAKRSLFGWPFKTFLLEMGGVPVDREGPRNYVQQMIDEFNARDEFMLTIAPEGTRSNVAKWKTGFYHIAMGAQVPIVVGIMDYGTRTGGLGPAIMPTGDFAADMKKIAKVYENVTPKNPQFATKDIEAVAINEERGND